MTGMTWALAVHARGRRWRKRAVVVTWPLSAAMENAGSETQKKKRHRGDQFDSWRAVLVRKYVVSLV
jgi:hypothetical protein